MAPHAYIPTYSNVARQFIFLIYFLKLYYIMKSDFTFILSWTWCGNKAVGEFFPFF